MSRIVLLPLLAGFLIGPNQPVLAAEKPVKKDDVCAAFDRAPDYVKDVYQRISREKACSAEYWSAFRGKTARMLFDEDTYRRYLGYLAQAKCDPALSIIKHAFVKVYPASPDIIAEDLHFIRWSSTVLPSHYPALALCLALRDIRQGQAEIERLGLKVARYKDIFQRKERFWNSPPAISKRNSGADALLFLLRYDPAVFALAELAHEGKIIRFIPDYQYFLLKVIKNKKLKGEKYFEMVAAAKARLSPDQLKDLARKIEKGSFEPKEPPTE